MDTQHTNLPASRTLENLGLSPQTVCGNCPNAVWFARSQQPKEPIPFCKLFHTVVDSDLSQCDGNPNLPSLLDLKAQEEWGEDHNEFGQPYKND